MQAENRWQMMEGFPCKPDARARGSVPDDGGIPMRARRVSEGIRAG